MSDTHAQMVGNLYKLLYNSRSFRLGRRQEHTGRVAARASANFNIQTPRGVIQGISHRHCTRVQRADGYGYSIRPKIALDTKEVARQAA